jgi:hypothetical protein
VSADVVQALEEPPAHVVIDVEGHHDVTGTRWSSLLQVHRHLGARLLLE